MTLEKILKLVQNKPKAEIVVYDIEDNHYCFDHVIPERLTSEWDTYSAEISGFIKSEPLYRVHHVYNFLQEHGFEITMREDIGLG